MDSVTILIIVFSCLVIFTAIVSYIIAEIAEQNPLRKCIQLCKKQFKSKND